MGKNFRKAQAAAAPEKNRLAITLPFHDFLAKIKNGDNYLKSSKILSGIMVLFIKGYQRLISPLIGSRCRFYPSCSNYAKEAIVKHGSLVGLVLSVYRILRCNPLSSGGLDNVPKKPLSWSKIKNKIISSLHRKNTLVD